MYLSLIELDPQSPETLKALRNPYKIHGAAEAAASGGRSSYKEHGRVLWRLNGTSLLMQTEDEPWLEGFQKQFGARTFSKEYSLPDGVKEGNRYVFRLTASTEQSCGGKRHVLTNPFEQMRWLEAKGVKHGFSLLPRSSKVMRAQEVTLYRKGKKIPTAYTTFDGILTVTDAAKFKECLITGIGHRKAFGCGLLSLIPVSTPKEESREKAI